MARRFSVPSAPAVYTTSYRDFKGVDYRPEEVAVERNRFADCRNIVFDKSGFPEKRLGWRKINKSTAKIYGVVTADIDGERITVMQLNRWLCTVDKSGSLSAISFEGEANPLGDAGNSGLYLELTKSTMFSMNDCVYVINEAGYLCVKKNEEGKLKAYNALEEAYVPTTTVNRRYIKYVETYNNSDDVITVETEPGTTYEKVNLLTDKRICMFISKSLSTLHSASEYSYGGYGEFTLDAQMDSIDKVEILSDEQEWVEVDNKLVSLVNTGVRIFNCYEDYGGAYGEGVYLPAMYADGITDNVRITYISKGSEENSKKNICNCNKAVKFGLNNDDRVFITGNDEFKNYIWYSDFNNPLYFPDLNYITVGADDKKVLGFSKLSGYLAVHKEESVEDANLYLVRGELTDEDAIFKVTTGIPGVGAISEKGFTSIEDEPLFLAKNGVFAIQSTYIAQEKCIASRSGFVNPELERYDLSNAVMTRWKNLIIIAVNDEKGTAFVLNVNAKAYVEDVSSPFYKTFYYESTVWDNVFADEFFLVGDELYFYRNTENGADICKFNSDIKDMTRFNDEALTEGAKAVDAWFKTKMDDDGSFMMLKTMVKRGCGAMIKPYIRSSAEIYVITDKEEKDIPIKTAEAGVLDFADLDFTLISFNTRDIATIIPLNTKVKKYSTLQFMVRNNELSQGMGVLGIEKRYKVGNYKKY